METQDNQLLVEVVEICRTLNLTTRIRRLLWLDQVKGSTVSSDECRFGLDLAVFPGRVRGRLAPNEWKPIITSSLIYRKILAKQLPGSHLLTVFVTFWILVIGGGILGNVLGTNAELPFLIYAVTVALPFTINRFTQARKKQRLKADVVATTVDQGQSLLSVLHKLEDMKLEDVIRMERRGLTRHFSSKPSVSERILNLTRANAIS